ncbi:MAG: DUF4249 domain-containing protein [Reichenbachiella sp.]
MCKKDPYIAIVLFFFMQGCLDSINLDLPSEEEKIVVFGWITDLDERYEVVISKTNAFNETEPYLTVSGAEVYVYDRNNYRFDFSEVGLTGIYLSDSRGFGIPNEKYELHIITMEGNHIVSTQEIMKPLPRIVNTFVEFSLDPDEVDIPPEQDNWFVGGLIEDESNIDNYYRWKIFVNGELRNNANELTLFDDKFTDGNVFRFDASNVLFLENDEVKLLSMSMSSLAYDYYRQLKNLTGNEITGPAFQYFPLKGNLVDTESEEEILGFFGASAVEEVEVQGFSEN